ncbi:MAG: serine hydrolase [Opitutae bacterium]
MTIAAQTSVPVGDMVSRMKQSAVRRKYPCGCNLHIPLRRNWLALVPCLLAIHLTAASPLPRSRPEAQGISSQDILKFVDAAERQIDALHSFMVVRHGHVVAEGWWAPYSAEAPHPVASIAKSFTSTAVGMAVAEGRMLLSDLVLSYFPESAPAEPSANLKAMRIRDLLIMSTGHDTVANIWASTEAWPMVFLAQPVPHKPGTHFLYNPPASYMLSGIVQKVTGMTMLDYLRPRLFEPLGIENPTWKKGPEGFTAGGWGLSLRTEDVAKFGQLYLQKGVWQGRQLIPAAWVEEATSRQAVTDSIPGSNFAYGYGYQFWCYPHGIYCSIGANGQFCVIIPEQDAVLVVTAETKNMGAIMLLLLEHFVPAMRANTLPVNDAAWSQLTLKLSRLALAPKAAAATTSAPAPPDKRP